MGGVLVKDGRFFYPSSPVVNEFTSITSIHVYLYTYFFDH